MHSAPRLWLPGLAAVLTALFASPAQAAGTEQRPTTLPSPPPSPAASWHGRPIQRPERDGVVLAQTVAVRGAPLEAGAGYAHPGGSQAVREVQRLLRRIGYRTGPVDGMFGPLTRSSVQWFQIKHGLRPTGAVGAVELALLRLRAGGKSPVQVRGVRLRTPVLGGGRIGGGRIARVHSPAGAPGGALPAPAVLAAAGAFASLAAAGALLLRRRRVDATGEPASRDRKASRAAGATATTGAVGYLGKADPREEKRRAHAIQQACAERGWAVAQIVREGGVNGADAHRRPGLAFALDELARRRGGRLVMCRLDDVGTTRRELATVLEWCSRSRVDLVALDVGLDTGTPAGSLAARCLVAVGDGGRSRPRRGGSSERVRVKT